jgi:hypothetical protein
VANGNHAGTFSFINMLAGVDTSTGTFRITGAN